jgi:hypothetical protein
MRISGGTLILVYSLLAVLSVPSTSRTQCPAKDDKSPKCGAPVVLEVIPGGKHGTEYRLDGKIYEPYPLTELANQVFLCTVERPLHVVIDSRVPAGEILGSVPSKLQASNVRYFIRYPEPNHLVIEIKIGEDFTSLP